MRTVKFTLDENEFRTLTKQAEELGVHRSALIRERVVTPPEKKAAAVTLTSSRYMDVITEVQRRMGNSIGRAQVEQCVAVAVRCLFKG